MPVLRSAFIALSRNRMLRGFCENSRFGRRMSSRFVAGMVIGDALRVAHAVNQQGMHVTLDSLGESVTSEVDAHKAADIYHQLLDQIGAQKVDANVSVKLTQMGLELEPKLAEEIALSLTEHAKSLGNFVRIDMEDSSLTQVTLDIVLRIHARPELRGSIGIVIQSYLYRSQADIEQLLSDGIRVRLCKGAYKEPAEVAFPSKADVDTNYVKLSHILLDSPIYHGLATHDEAMIAAAKAFATQHKIVALSSRCYTACGATCSGSWWPKATTCGSTFHLGGSGIRTSCGVSRNAQRMSCSWPKTSSGTRNDCENAEHDREDLIQIAPGRFPVGARSAAAQLVCAVSLNAARFAQVLLSDHERLPADRTFPGIIAEERIDLQLQKALARQSSQVVSAFSAVHFNSPDNSFQQTI
jgi:proline dehydrogenase